jgi:peptidoglycan/xylan/chitin deacetylase (PgdA/CDA1 family)
MDDLPVHGALPEGETRGGVAERIVAAFRAAGVPEVYGFVNGVRVEEAPESGAALAAWTAAGYPLGNHGWAHENLNRVSAAEFEAEIVRNEATLERFGRGRDWRWFRYPFLAGRRRPRAARLRAGGARAARLPDRGRDHGLLGLAVERRVRALPGWRHSAGARVPERAYLDAVREATTRSRGLSRAVYGRDVPYVLLTHVSPFNARMMPRVLALYREEGFRFTTLAAAQADSVYARDTDPARPAGPTSLEARARGRGLPLPPRTDRRRCSTPPAGDRRAPPRCLTTRARGASRVGQSARSTGARRRAPARSRGR